MVRLGDLKAAVKQPFCIITRLKQLDISVQLWVICYTLFQQFVEYSPMWSLRY
jgi:hypothetical protein